MKRVTKLSVVPHGVENYLDVETLEPRWERFHSYEGGRAYKELVRALVGRQHGLCAYCEIAIGLTERDRQVEHVVPQSDPQDGRRLALDVGNLVACCKGGTARSADTDRYLAPVRKNRSCGEAKRNLRLRVEPRTLPALPSVTRVRDDGCIEADADACASAGIAEDDVVQTIEVLNLNAPRLRVAREKHWLALNDQWQNDFDDPEVVDAAARGELLPHDNRLSRFFTTTRGFFGPVAEQILAEEPRSWI